jgi:hypothetical protein
MGLFSYFCRSRQATIAALKEVAAAQDAMLYGKAGACAAHLSKAMCRQASQNRPIGKGPGACGRPFECLAR